jgi:hypothetical protein
MRNVTIYEFEVYHIQTDAMIASQVGARFKSRVTRG